MMEFDGLLLSMVYLMDVVEIYLVVNFVVMRYTVAEKIQTENIVLSFTNLRFLRERTFLV